jgi:hypothetical protein
MAMEFLQQILYAIIVAAVPVITTYVCKWLQSLYENNKSKIKNEKMQTIIGLVADMIAASVETTTSTYVKELKSNDMFDADAQKEAFNKTFNAVKRQLTEDSIKIIAETYGDVDMYLTNKIEQLVEQTKK